MSEEQLLDHIRAFVNEHYMYRHPEITLTDDLDLLESGIIDSLGVIELVGEVEEHFTVPVADVDVTEENFGSVAGVVRFVSCQRAAAA